MTTHAAARRPKPADRLPFRGACDLARRLVATLPTRGQYLDARGLTDSDLDDLEDAAAGILRSVRDEQDRRIGLKVRTAPTTRAPWRAPWSDGLGDASWADHVYVTDHDAVGRVYVSEPYQLEGPELRRLVALVDAGWRVVVSGVSRHYPGRTLGVHLSSPGWQARYDARAKTKREAAS